MHEFSHYAGFVGEDKDRFAITFGTEPRRLSIVGRVMGDGGLIAPDADISVAIKLGTDRQDALALLRQITEHLERFGDVEDAAAVALSGGVQ